jgi:hypothetical protein
MRWVEAIPVVTGLLYAAAAYGYFRLGEGGFGLAYAGYAVANIGLILAAIAGRS